MYQTSGMRLSDQHTLNLNKSAYFKSIGYEPEPIQWAVHNSKARFRVDDQVNLTVHQERQSLVYLKKIQEGGSLHHHTS